MHVPTSRLQFTPQTISVQSEIYRAMKPILEITAKVLWLDERARSYLYCRWSRGDAPKIRLRASFAALLSAWKLTPLTGSLNLITQTQSLIKTRWQTQTPWPSSSRVRSLPHTNSKGLSGLGKEGQADSK